MGTRDLFSPDAKARVGGVIAEIERQTSAEIVVALRRASDRYRHTDYAAGAVAAWIALAVFLYHPEPFDFTWLPLELAAIFAVFAIASAASPPARRLFTSAKVMDASVRRAARELFVDRGIARTKGRTGILVYVSALERRAEIVADAGVDEGALGPRWVDAKAKIGEAIDAGSIDALVEALRAMGPILGDALPRAADDVNELPDEVAS